MNEQNIVISDRRKLNISATLHECGLRRVSPSAPMEPEKDRHWLLAAHAGDGTLLGVGEQRVPIHAGCLIYAEENAGYRIESDSGLELYYVSFSGYLVREYFVRAGFHPVYPVHDYGDASFFDTAFADMLSFAQVRNNRYCRMLARFYDMLAHVIDLAEASVYNIHEPFGQTFYLTKALVFISNHFNEDITVTDIAAYVGIGRKYLHAIFSKQIGQSPSRYLMEFRMSEACKLMTVSQITVAELARAVGYRDPFQFSRMFKRLRGMPPTEYCRVNHAGNASSAYLVEQLAGMNSLLRQRKRELDELRGARAETESANGEES